MTRDASVCPPPAAPVLPADWGVLIETLLDAVWLVDGQSLCVVAANAAAGALLGQPAPALVGQHVLDLTCSPEDQCFWGEVQAGLTDRIESDTVIATPSGALRSVTRRVSRFAPPGAAGLGGPLFTVAMRDRSEQVRIELELERTAADLRATLESTHDGILVVDLSGHIRNFNQRFATLWQLPGELLVQRDDDTVLDWMRRAVADPAGYMRRLAAIDSTALLRSSDIVQLAAGRVLERVTQPQLLNGQPIGRVYAFRDITAKLEAEQRIETLALTDTMTGLPNRRLLTDRAEVALARARRDGTPFALLLLSLDRFSMVNETLGRVLGDRVLQDVAERIRASLRQVDTVARLEGDEFAVLVNQGDAQGAAAAAARVSVALALPFVQRGEVFALTASVGISLYPNDGTGLDELLHRAEAAVREIKRAGRGQPAD